MSQGCSPRISILDFDPRRTAQKQGFYAQNGVLLRSKTETHDVIAVVPYCEARLAPALSILIVLGACDGADTVPRHTDAAGADKQTGSTGGLNSGSNHTSISTTGPGLQD